MIDLIFFAAYLLLVKGTVFKKKNGALRLICPKLKRGALLKTPNKNSSWLNSRKRTWRLNGKRLDFAQMETELRLVTDKTLPVEVRIDKMSAMERIIKVFDLLKNQELFNLRLVTT